MRHLLLLTFSLTLGACSLYQSESRKFLEKQAFEFAASAQAHLIECPTLPTGGDWVLAQETVDAQIYFNETEDYQMKIIPKGTGEGSFSCVFRFSSPQEMVEKTGAAIDLTLFYLGLSLGEFAFHPISHLK